MPVFDLLERTMAKTFKVPTGILPRLVIRSAYVGKTTSEILITRYGL